MEDFRAIIRPSFGSSKPATTVCRAQAVLETFLSNEGVLCLYRREADQAILIRFVTGAP